MRHLKLVGYSLVFFFLQLTAVGLLFPGDVHISRAIDLPAQRKASLMQWMNDASFRWCWQDSMGRMNPQPIRTSDSSYALLMNDRTTIQWIFHGADGRITLQGRVDVQLGWLPWERFKSLLMEPRYGSWLEKELEKFRICLSSAQLAAVSP